MDERIDDEREVSWVTRVDKIRNKYMRWSFNVRKVREQFRSDRWEWHGHVHGGQNVMCRNQRYVQMCMDKRVEVDRRKGERLHGGMKGVTTDDGWCGMEEATVG